MGAIWNRLCVSHRTWLLYMYSGTYSKLVPMGGHNYLIVGQGCRL